MLRLREMIAWLADYAWLLRPFAMRRISLSRFNALAGYARHPRTMLICDELDWVGSRDVRMVRVGLALDPDPNAANPRPFRSNVYDRDYFETWNEGLEVFHNPHAIKPVDNDLLPGAIHHRLRSDGQMVSSGPIWHPLTSHTLITVRSRNWLERM